MYNPIRETSHVQSAVHGVVIGLRACSFTNGCDILLPVLGGKNFRVIGFCFHFNAWTLDGYILSIPKSGYDPSWMADTFLSTNKTD